MGQNSVLPFSLLFSVLCVNKFINAVPSDYCYSQLNTSDCQMPPIPVFTYYKPGSRCEIELWRGCTTLNKFENEYECSHVCISKLIPSFNAELDNEIVSSETKKRECEMKINLGDCGRLEEVYTYNSKTGKCHKIEWRGCETYNKFDDFGSCMKTCKTYTKGSGEKVENGTDSTHQKDKVSQHSDEISGNDSGQNNGQKEDQSENHKKIHSAEGSEDASPDEEEVTTKKRRPGGINIVNINNNKKLLKDEQEDEGIPTTSAVL